MGGAANVGRICLGVQLPVSTAVYIQLEAGGFRRPDPPDRVWYRMSAVPLDGRGICLGSIRTLLLRGVPVVGVDALYPPGVL